MVIVAIVSLLAGILCGQFIFSEATCAIFANIADYSLYLLMLCVGISIGMNKNAFQKIKEYHVRILIIPIGIVIGSILGGYVCALVFDMPLSLCMSISSGMGWYSLSGVLIGNLAGAQAGSIAFLSNLLREILSFFSIPIIAKYLNFYTTIAPAGATSEDTTLPMMIKYTNEETTIMAVFNGVACSALVPILINFFSYLNI